MSNSEHVFCSEEPEESEFYLRHRYFPKVPRDAPALEFGSVRSVRVGTSRNSVLESPRRRPDQEGTGQEG